MQAVAVPLPFATAGVALATSARAVRLWRERGTATGGWRSLLPWLSLAAAGVATLHRPRAGLGSGDPGVVRPTLRVLSLNTGGEQGGGVLPQAHVTAFQETRVHVRADGVVFAPRVWMQRATGLPAGALPAGETHTPVVSDLLLAHGPEHELGPEDGAGRYSRAVIAWEGRQVAVYNAHFRSYRRPSARAAWRRVGRRSVDWRGWRTLAHRIYSIFREDVQHRADEARRFRALLALEPLPFVAAADFNATPDQWSRAHVTSGLREAFGSRAPWAFTFPSSLPFVQIDGVFVSHHWWPLGGRVGGRRGPDHRAVVVDLVWAPERGLPDLP